MPRPYSCILVLVGGMLACGSASAQGVQFRNVALSGQQAPGTPAGVTFSAFQAVTMNGSGRVGVFATLAGAGITAANRDGIWWDVPGSLQLVMRQGDAAPGQAGLNYTGTTAPNLSDSGIMTYSALIAPTGGGSRDSVWTIGPSSPPAAFLVQLAQVPGQAPGVVWGGFNTPNINASGAVGFRAILGGTIAGNAHLVGPPTALAFAAIEGSPTGVLPGVNFAGVLNDYRVNSAGVFAFITSLAGPGITTSNNLALWVRSPAGVLRLVARTGDQVPGQADGVTYTSIIRGPELDGTGRVAYTFAMAGPGITSANNQGAFLDDAGVKTLLVQRGDQAPGVPAGVLWNGSFGLTLGEQGLILLQAQLTGSGVVTANRSGIWKRVGAGPFSLVARAGSPAPGTSPARNFDQVDTGNANIATNNSGRFMVAAAVTGPSADGIWLEDGGGVLRLVVLEGTPFDVNDDPNVTVLKTPRRWASRRRLGPTMGGGPTSATLARSSSARPLRTAPPASSSPGCLWRAIRSTSTATG